MGRILSFLAVVSLAACSTELPHEASYDPNSPFEKQARATLTARILLEGETDYSQITVEVQNDARTYSIDTDAQGNAKLTGLVPGTYRLSLRTRYFEPVTQSLIVGLGETLAVGPLSLRALRSDVVGTALIERLVEEAPVSTGGASLTLRKTGSIRSAGAGAPRYQPARAADTVTIQAVSTSDGSYTFSGVPVGSYELIASGTDVPSLTIPDVQVMGEGTVVVDDVVLSPVTGFFKIAGTRYDGTTDYAYTATSDVTLELLGVNAPQVQLGLSADGTASGCKLDSPIAYSESRSFSLGAIEGRRMVCVQYLGENDETSRLFTKSIFYDKTPPAPVVVTPLANNGYVTTDYVLVNLAAVDAGSGVADIKLGKTADMTAVSTSTLPFQPTLQVPLGTAGPYIRYLWVRDAVGNPSAMYTLSVTVDTLAPVPAAALSIDGGASETNERQVPIAMDVPDAAEMQLSESSSFAGALWQPFAASTLFTLSSGDGLKTIWARYRDQAGNVSDPDGASVTLDRTPPQNLTVSVAESNPSNATEVTLSFSALGSPSHIQISENIGFVGAVEEPYTAGPVVRQLEAGDGVHTIYVRVRDTAGNWSALASKTISIDSVAPTDVSAALQVGSLTNQSTLSLLLSASGAYELQVTGDVAGGTPWLSDRSTATVALTAGDGTKVLWVQWRDQANNYALPVSVWTVLDQAKPSNGSIAIGTAEVTSSTAVTLNISYDPTAAEMMIANESGFVGAGWEPVAATREWYLTAADGGKTVYIKFRDAAGNESANSVFDTITLDTKVPSSPYVDIQAAATSATTVQVVLGAAYVDEMVLSENDNFSGANWQAVAPTTSYTFTGSDGLKTLYAKFRKASGLETGVVSDSYILDTTPPGPIVVTPLYNDGYVQTDYLLVNVAAVDGGAGVSTLKLGADPDMTVASALPFQSTLQVALGGDGPYTRYLWVLDAAGNASAMYTVFVTVDTQKPVAVTALSIDGGASETNERQVSLSLDVPDAVEMQVSESSSFAGAVWQPFMTSTLHTLSSGDGMKTLWARYRDAAGNISDTDGATIWLDRTAPSNLTATISESSPSKLTEVTLTLSSTGSAAEMQISENAAFVGALTEPYTELPVVRRLTAGDGVHTLYVRVRDSAGNWSAVASASILIDNDAPTYGDFTIETPSGAQAGYIRSTSVGLTFFALNADEIQLQEDTICGGGWTAFTTSTTVNVSTGDGTKDISVRYRDAAGNESLCLTKSVILDELQPSGSVVLNGNEAQTNVRTVDVTLSASEPVALQLSESGTFGDAAWRPFTTATQWTFSAADGTRRLYARFRDRAGNLSSNYDDDILIDTAAPTDPSITLAGGVNLTNQTEIGVSAVATGADYVRVANSSSFSGANWLPYPASITNHPLTAGEGLKTVYTQFKDEAGNLSAVVSDTIVKDTQAPVEVSIAIAEAPLTNQSTVTAVLSASGADEVRLSGDIVGGSTGWLSNHTSVSVALSAGDATKEVTAQWRDLAGNLSAIKSASVTLDQDPPADGSVAINASDLTNNPNVMLNLTSGGDAVEMMISNASGFVGAAWEPVSSTLPWTVASGDGTKTVYVKYRDEAGNQSSAVNDTIVLDTTPPTSTSFTIVEGATTGNPRINLSLSAVGATAFWSANTPDFSDGSWRTYATGATHDVPSGDGLKVVYVKFRDAAANESATLTQVITLDTGSPTGPQLVINAGAVYTKDANVTLSLNAADANEMTFSNDGLSFGSWEPFAPTRSYTFAGTDGTKTVWVKYRDAALNETAKVDDSIILDREAPTGTNVVVANGEAYTRSQTVIVTLTATDATLMQVSEDNSFSGMAWEPFAGTKQVALSSGQGAKTVHARFKDEAGWVTNFVSDGITFDSVAPASNSLAINGGASSTNVTDVTLTIGTNDLSAEMRLSESSDFGGTSWIAYSSPKAFTLSTGDGTKAVYLQLRDQAGNESGVVSKFIQLDTEAPTGEGITINGGALWATSANVSLAISGNGATDMQVSEDSGFTAATWEPFTMSYAYTILGGEGSRTVYLRLRDAAGNVSGTASDAITLDTQKPTIPALTIVQKPSTKSAGVQVLLSAVGATELMLGDDAGFGGRSWQPYMTATNWTLPPGDGTKTVYAKYRDAAGNVSDLASDSSVLDTTPPVAGNLTVNGGGTVTNSTVVAYAISATDALSEPLEIQISGDGTFSGAVWKPYASTGTHAIAPGDGVRSLYVRARDSVGNVSLTSNASFILDQTGAEISYLSVNEGRTYVSSIVKLDFQVGAWAPGDVVEIDLAGDFSNPTAYAVSPGLNTQWYALSGIDGNVTLYVRARDVFGNYGPVLETPLIRDTTPPAAVFSPPIVIGGGGDFTTSRLVNLDLLVTGASEMLVANDPSFADAAWEPFVTNTLWALPLGDATYTVYAKFRDAAHNVIGPYADVITVDTAVPTSPSLVINGGDSYATAVTVALTLSAVGADKMQISADGVFDTEPLVDYDTSASWVVTPSEGLKVLYARFCDVAGNCTAPANASISLDRTAPTGGVVVNQGAARTASGIVALNLTASDVGSGLQGVRIANSLAALATTDVVTYESTKIWTLAAPTGAGLELTKEVWTQVVDRAGLTSEPMFDTIVYDTFGPTGGIAVGTARTKDTLVGVDLTFAADTTQMKISNGNACAGGNWIEVSAQTLWSIPAIEGTNWVSVRFRDSAMNESASCYADSVELDRTGPTPKTFVVKGNSEAKPGYTNTANLAITGSTLATDCAYAELSEDVGFIAPTGMIASCNFINEAYTLFNASDGFHDVYLRYFDTLGNAGAVTKATVVLDTSTPTVSSAEGFTIREGEYVNVAAVTLDMHASGVDQMSIAENSSCSSSWTDFADPKPWSLTSSDGVKTLSVQFRDDAGNLTNCYSQAVTLDTVLNSFTVTLTGQEGRTDLTASLAVTADVVGVDLDVVEMRISNSATFGDANWIAFQGTFEWFLPSGDGSKVVYVEIRDRAGNTSSSSGTIFLDQTPPEAPNIQIIDITGDGFALSATHVELSWSTPSGTETFELYRFVSAQDEDFRLIATFGLGVNTYADTVTQSGYTHNYRIQAIDEIGNISGWSSIAGGMPFEPVDSAYWLRDREGNYSFRLSVPHGTFGLDGLYSYEEMNGDEKHQALMSNSIDFAFLKNWETFNDKMVLRTSNQTNSLVYESSLPLDIQVRETVDAEGDVGRFTSLAIDASGNIHIAYRDNGNSNLKYATNASGRWQTEDVDTTGSVGVGNNGISIAADAAGRAHISYWDSANTALKYATNVTGPWDFTIIGQGVNFGQWSDLVLDGDGNVHISFFHHFPGREVKYANNVNGTWSIDLVEGNLGDFGGYTSLAVDADGVAHISYRNANFGNGVRYANNSSGSFVPEVVEAGVDGRYTSLVLDPTGTVHVSYGLNEVRYANNQGGSFSPESVATGLGIYGGHSSLALDDMGNPYVSYYSETDGDLKVAVKENGLWLTHLVDTLGNVGRYTSMSLDVAGRSHISYYDYGNLKLKYAMLGVVAPMVREFDTDGLYSSLVLDDKDRSHVAYRQGSNLKYATNVSGLWTSESVNIGGDQSNSMSLTLDSVGNVHISFYGALTRVLRVVSNEFGPWNIENVDLDNLGVDGGHTSLAIDDNDDLHISYFDGVNYDLKYARTNGAIWVTDVVDDAGAVGSWTSLALDSAGEPHISYYAIGLRNLKYAVKSNGVWVLETVDSSGDVGQHTALALDSEDNAHISYYSATGSKLMYVTNRSGTWITEEIDTAENVGLYTSLALDSQDKVHISYRDATNQNLKYATNASGTWMRVTIDKEGNVGEYTSVAVDSRDRAHITYRALGVALRYAREFNGSVSNATVKRMSPF